MAPKGSSILSLKCSISSYKRCLLAFSFSAVTLLSFSPSWCCPTSFLFTFPLSLGCNSQLQVPWNWKPFSPLRSWVGHSGERNRDEPEIVWRRSKTELLRPLPLKRWSWISWRLYRLILPSYHWNLLVYNTIISVLLFSPHQNLRFYFHTGSVNVERKKILTQHCFYFS